MQFYGFLCILPAYCSNLAIINLVLDLKELQLKTYLVTVVYQIFRLGK